LSNEDTENGVIRKVVLDAIKNGKAEIKGIKASMRKVSISELFEEKELHNFDGWLVTELFDLEQGVTWGGENCKEIYVIGKEVAGHLEQKLLYKTIGGRDIKAGRIDWREEYLIFPYVRAKSKWIPVFRHPSLGGDDALDFAKSVSSTEEGKDIKGKLNYRIAKGLVSYPLVASYFVEHYEKLENREFEDKKMSSYNKCWYEYHRPRKVSLLKKPKIVYKRVMKDPSFAIDEKGYLPRDSVVSMTPRNKFAELKANIESILKKEVTVEQALGYAVAFLNSDLFREVLEHRRSKKRGGYPIVDERLMKRFTIPRGTSKDVSILNKILQGNADEKDLLILCRPSRKKQAKLTHLQK
jgi:hypothetical protein